MVNVAINPANLTVDQVLPEARQNLTSKLGLKIKAERDCKVGQFAGKELDMEIPPENNVGKIRIFVAGHRIFSILVVPADKAPVPSGTMEKFLDSLKIDVK